LKSCAYFFERTNSLLWDARHYPKQFAVQKYSKSWHFEWLLLNVGFEYPQNRKGDCFWKVPKVRGHSWPSDEPRSSTEPFCPAKMYVWSRGLIPMRVP
jgi:hypothetical protein